MRTVWLVIRHEATTILRSRSFWIMTLVFPLLLYALTALPEAASRRAFQRQGRALAAQASAPVGTVGYVDPGGLLRSLPPDLAPGRLLAFPDETAARQAVAAGVVSQYYLIPSDYVQSGRLVLVDRIFSPLVNLGGGALIERALDFNLVGDAALAARLRTPIGEVVEHPQGPRVAARRDFEVTAFAVPFAVMFILFFVLTVSAGYMLQSVTKEKQSRTAEVLLLCLRPRQLMLGKLVGLGFVALVQMTIWLGGSFVLLRSSRSLLPLLGGQPIPISFFGWALAYFLLGYVVYASAMGALGALVPDMREGSQVTFVLLMPLLLPFILNSVFVSNPDGAVALFLSLFPLTAPTAMVTRLVASDVPVWQPALGLALLAVTAYFFVLVAARFFRADNLLSNASVDWLRPFRR
jgi:ABC-2 type transport system permease protein